MSFWQSGSGATITGKPDQAFLQDFTVIPDGTTALASIKSFELVEKEATQYHQAQKFYQITWMLTSGEFAKRQVTQKIKCFDKNVQTIDRSLNMLKLIMDLSNFKPSHPDAPTTNDLRPMIGNIMGIKIREWSQPKEDGNGFIEGNYVSEVHPAQGFTEEVGVKLEPKIIEKKSGLDSAFSRNKQASDDELFADVSF